MRKRGWTKACIRLAMGCAAAVLLAAAFMGCKQDCSEAARAGDFEFSQGNYVNAAKHYRRALKADANCYDVERKLGDAQRRAAQSR